MDHLDIHHPPAATEDDWQARCGVQKIVQTDRYGVTVRPTHLPDPDAKGDGVHLI